jgi:hypothetical protein
MSRPKNEYNNYSSGPVATPSQQYHRQQHEQKLHQQQLHHQQLHHQQFHSQRQQRNTRLSMTAPRERPKRNVEGGIRTSTPRGFATARKPSLRPASSTSSSLTPQSKSDARAMHRMLSTLFGHFGRKQLDGSLTMKTFLRLAKASNIIKDDYAEPRAVSPFDEKEQSKEEDGMITIKRLTSIIERVQTQYGDGRDHLRFPMSCAVLLRISRCQYLYRAECLGNQRSQGNTETLDATAFGALCREKLAPLYMHLMMQLGGGGDRETKHITVGGSTYLLEQSKIACQRNQTINLEDDGEHFNLISKFVASSTESGLKSMRRSSGGSKRGSGNRKSNVQNSVQNSDNQSWEDVVRQLRSANDIADGLLVGGSPSRGGLGNSLLDQRDGTM